MNNWFVRIPQMLMGEESPPWWLLNWKELTVALILFGIITDAFIYLVRERPAWFITLLRKTGLVPESDRPDTLRPKKREDVRRETPETPALPPVQERPKPAPIAARPPSGRPVDFSPRPKGVIAAPNPAFANDDEPKRVRLTPIDGEAKRHSQSDETDQNK